MSAGLYKGVWPSHWNYSDSASNSGPLTTTASFQPGGEIPKNQVPNGFPDDLKNCIMYVVFQLIYPSSRAELAKPGICIMVT